MKKFEPKVQSFYNADSAVYDQRWQTPGGRYTFDSQAKIVQSICSLWLSKHSLEIGCGTGRFSVLVGSLHENLTVVDLANSMLRKTKQRVKEHQLEGSVQKYVNASAYDLPFESKSFDAIVSINVFSHLEYPLKVLEEIVRIHRNNGRLLISFPNLYSYYLIPGLFVNMQKQSLQRRVYSRWYKPSDIFKMMSGTGYEILSVTGNTHIPKSLDRLVIRDLFSIIDQKSRYTWFKNFAPIWFVECVRRV